MKKRLMTILSLLIIAVICCATAVYAFFQFAMPIETEKIPEYNVADDGSDIIFVTTESELFIAAQDNYYNPANTVSEKRTTIKFNGNITLSSHLFITADVHIDLNNYTLFLNGNTVTVMHDYVGTFMIKGGSFQPLHATDKLYINTRKADIITDITFTDGENTLNAENYIEIINSDKRIVAYNIFYMVANLLKGGYSYNINRINYGALISDYGTGETLDFSLIEFNEESGYSPFGESPYCYYLSGDIDLPLGYHNYALTLSYSSSDLSAIDSKGKVNPDTAQVKNVTLTASVQFEGESEIYASYEYEIVLIHKEDASSQTQLARARMLDYIKGYWDFVDTDGDETNDLYCYSFNGEVSFPVTDQLGGVTYIYEAYDENFTLKDSTQALTDGVSENEHLKTLGNSAYIFAVSADINYLRIGTTLGGATIYTDYLPVYGQSATIEDNYSIAQNIISQWYADKIEITNSPLGINGYTTQRLYKDISAFAGKGVLAVNYYLVNNAEGTYAITEEEGVFTLHVASGHHPDTLQRVFLTASFTFTDWEEHGVVNISLPIVYNPDSSSGNSQIHPFLPYYIYFNRIFGTEAGSSTYKEFSMPLYYPTGNPAVVYDIIGDTSNAITLQLYYDGVAHTLTLGSYTSYTQAFDAYLTTNSLTLSQIIAYGDAKWVFSIDTDKIGTADKNISLKYNYKFGSKSGNSYDYSGVTSWESYTAADSSFVLSGILRVYDKNNSNANTEVYNETLYKWIYDNYNTMADIYNATADRHTKYILTSWLTQEKNIDNSSNALFNIDNYKGIEYLKGVKVLKLNNLNKSMTVWEYDIIPYISQMSGLEELRLAINALYDRAQNSYAFPTGNDNNFIGILSVLSNLRILDLSDNKIFDFSDLLDFMSLEEVYTYNNSHTATVSWGGLATILTNMSNSTYGSKGSTNIAVYQQLYQEKGVKIYHENADTPYAGSTGVSDYTKMRNITYQDRLPEGVSIEEVYEFLSTNPADYGIDPPGTVQYWVISFDYVGDSPTTATEFTMTYSYEIELQNGTTILGVPTYGWFPLEMTITFTVTRIN